MSPRENNTKKLDKAPDKLDRDGLTNTSKIIGGSRSDFVAYITARLIKFTVPITKNTQAKYFLIFYPFSKCTLQSYLITLRYF